MPSSDSDIVLATSFQSLTANGTSIHASSLNQLNDSAYTISNGTLILVPSAGGGNSVSPNSADSIYLGGSASHLTVDAEAFFANDSNLDVAQTGGILDLTNVIVSNTGTITKTGAGVLNLNGTWNVFSGSFNANGGTTNMHPGFSENASFHFSLGVNNLNTEAGTDVILNVQTSVEFYGLSGSVAQASSGANTATINLSDQTIQLSLVSNTGPPPNSRYAGNIVGTGSVLIGHGGTNDGYVQTFSGTNTYTGTTTINGGTLHIDGTTIGQGNYIVSGNSQGPPATTLGGNGTIGLATNGNVTVGGGIGESRLSPGTDGTVGTLHITTSGTGGVIFSNVSVFTVDIAGAGSSDLLSIAGGNIDLTGGGDTLSLVSLSGAFDGSVYTIATFVLNAGNGIFNSVVGLPANYAVSYGPTSITIGPIPEPSTWALLLSGSGLLGFLWRKQRLA